MYSLTLHPDRSLIATGQTGKKPYICVWDSSSLETQSILQGGHTNGVGAVSFDKTGLVSTLHYLFVFQIRKLHMSLSFLCEIKYRPANHFIYQCGR